MNIVFRTDATSQIGSGHFMRSLTLADAMKQCGAQIRFVSGELPVHLRDMLAEKDSLSARRDRDSGLQAVAVITSVIASHAEARQARDKLTCREHGKK